MTKNQIQFKAVELFAKYSNLFLEWATGTGKTKAALDIVSTLKGRGYIVLSETTHKANWKADILKHGHEDILGRSTMVLYASIHKLANTEIDWVIYDEAHNGLGSDKRIGAIKSIKCNNNIFLSATLDEDHKYTLKYLFKRLHTYTITLNDAIKWNLIPKPEINLIEVELNDENINQNFILTKGLSTNRIELECKYSERWKILKENTAVNLKVHCTQHQKYIWLEEQMEYWRKLYFRTKAKWNKDKWLQFGSQRKRFLSEVKTPHALDISKKLSNKKSRFICFAGSIDQAETLGSHNNVVHSKNKNNQEIINNFNKGKISNIFAISMLQEGVNLTDIESGLIVQLDGSTRRYIQKSGRIFRGQKPIQYIIYVKNTRDEEFLNNALQGLKQYIK